MTRIHHIGYLVKDLDKSIRAFLALGYRQKGGPVLDEGRDVEIVFLEKDGSLVELVEPKSAESVAAGLMKTRKNSPYHMCFETDDMAGELERLRASGFMRIDELAPAPAIGGGAYVTFLVSPSIGIIELLTYEKGGE